MTLDLTIEEVKILEEILLYRIQQCIPLHLKNILSKLKGLKQEEPIPINLSINEEIKLSGRLG